VTLIKIYKFLITFCKEWFSRLFTKRNLDLIAALDSFMERFGERSTNRTRRSAHRPPLGSTRCGSQSAHSILLLGARLSEERNSKLPSLFPGPCQHPNPILHLRSLFGYLDLLQGDNFLLFKRKRQSKHRIDLNLPNGISATTRPGSGGAAFQMLNRPVRQAG